MPSPRPHLLPSLLLALALSAPSPRAQPADPIADVHQYVNGLSWRVVGYGVFARGDAYRVHARLDFDPRYADRKLTLLPGSVVLELSRPEGPARTHVLFKSDVPRVCSMHDPDAMNATLDLRDAFGELEPGPWVARWILREGRYKVQGHTTSSEVVAEYPFHIIETTRDAAARTSRPTTDVVLEVPPPGAKTPAQTLATLTNRTNKMIEFAASPASVDRGQPTWREPLDADLSLAVEHFVPPATWRNLNGVPIDGPDTAYRLAPGKSVRIKITDLRGAQFVRVRLGYRIAGDPTFSPHEAISDILDIPPTDAKNQRPPTAP